MEGDRFMEKEKKGIFNNKIVRAVIKLILTGIVAYASA